jgi:ACS family tartrate transporter-like MFS transporter
LSGVVGGPLSSLLLELNGVAGLHGWQWLFLMEGLPAILLAFAVLEILPDGPARASWLTKAEKDAVAVRLAAEEPAGRPDLWPALRDPRLLALAIAFFIFFAAVYGLALWLPQIVKAMGFSNLATGFVVALCFAACIPAMILGGRSSSRMGERIWHVALPWLCTASCLAAASLAQSHAIVLAALAIGLAANYATYGPLFSLPSSFLRGAAAADGTGLIGSFANFGAFLGPVLVGVLMQGSGNYSTGFAADAVGFVLAALIVIAVGRALASRAAVVQAAIG